jgi:hypothetical protein
MLHGFAKFAIHWCFTSADRTMAWQSGSQALPGTPYIQALPGEAQEAKKSNRRKTRDVACASIPLGRESQGACVPRLEPGNEKTSGLQCGHGPAGRGMLPRLLTGVTYLKAKS